MVYIIVAKTYSEGEIVINDSVYATYELAQESLERFRSYSKEFDEDVMDYEIRTMYIEK